MDELCKRMAKLECDYKKALLMERNELRRQPAATQAELEKKRAELEDKEAWLKKELEQEQDMYHENRAYAAALEDLMAQLPANGSDVSAATKRK